MTNTLLLRVLVSVYAGVHIWLAWVAFDEGDWVSFVTALVFMAMLCTAWWLGKVFRERDELLEVALAQSKTIEDLNSVLVAHLRETTIEELDRTRRSVWS